MPKTSRKNRRAKSTKLTKKTVIEETKPGKIVIELPKLSNVIDLTKFTVQLIWDNRKFFIGLTLIYGLLNLILVQGLASSSDITSAKSELTKIFSGNLGDLASGFSVFAVLLGSSGNSSSPTAGAYQLFLGLITSLAIIWSLRQIMAGKTVRIKDAYYRGMTPLIPFILVLIVVGIELLPLLIGVVIYSTVNANSIAIGFIEQAAFGLLLLVLALLSFYLITVSLIALYIVTLDNMTPRKALKSAKELVKARRWTTMRKILFLPIALMIAAAIIMVPIIVWLTAIASWVFFLLTMFSLVAIHTYMYSLYRELLNEA